MLPNCLFSTSGLLGLFVFYFEVVLVFWVRDQMKPSSSATQSR